MWRDVRESTCTGRTVTSTTTTTTNRHKVALIINRLSCFGKLETYYILDNLAAYKVTAKGTKNFLFLADTQSGYENAKSWGTFYLD